MPIPEEQKIKLESMQIKGIKTMIWQNIEEENIESRLLQIKKQNFTNDIKKLVNSQSRTILIELIEISPEILPQTIDAAYEKYRYGLKPGFTLFWAKYNSDISFDKTSLESKIKEFIAAQKYGEDDKYKNLEFVSIIEFGGTYEISLSYLQKFNYINEEGEFTYVYMMKECFSWIGIDKNFIAINNMPEVLMNTLKRFFSSLYSADITNIKITSKLLEKVFPSEKTKRVTRHNANPPENQLEKVTFADQNLGDKKDCIPNGYEDYDITNTQYVEDIDENTTGTLGVNCNKGKMYLSKSLTSSQFRAWSTRRIDNIISFFQNSSDVTLETVSGFNMFSSSSWDSIKKTSIPILDEIALAIITCKKSNLDSYPISFDLYKAYTELGNKFYGKVRCSCDVCEEDSIPSCPDCGGTQFTITKKTPARIICDNCGKAQAGTFVFDCENGHTNKIGDINEAIELISTDSFAKQLICTIKLYYADISFERNEYFSLSNDSLTVHKSPNYEKLRPSDIKEFAPIVNRQFTHSTDELQTMLCQFKEKCSHPSNNKCGQCKHETISNKSEIKCILKLFEGFEGYVPQPHQGHEFGDVSMLVTFNGKNITFLGVAKSVNLRASKITKASDVGREIIQQVIDAFNDKRAELVGVIYPDIIDDQLEELISETDSAINTMVEKYENLISLLRTIPGVDRNSAITIISEIGTDVSQFDSSKRLCCWAGLTPGNNESAGKKKSVKIARAGVYLKPALVQIAHAAVISTENPYYRLKYEKISKQRKEKSHYCHSTNDFNRCFSNAVHG